MADSIPTPKTTASKEAPIGKAETTVTIPRIFHDSLGHSHFDNIHVRIKDKSGSGAGGIGQLSSAIPATSIMFRRTPGDYLYDWHHAPTEQFIVNLDADVDVTVTDGSSRRLHAGEVFYVEDTKGSGHKSQAVNGQDRNSIFVPCSKNTLLSHLVPSSLQYGNIDLRVGVIQSVEAHPNADGLFVESIDVGDKDGPRQVVSGLVHYFPAEALQGRKVVVVCNMPRAKLRGVPSNGMILCATNNNQMDTDPETGGEICKLGQSDVAAATKDPIKSGVGSDGKSTIVAFVEPPADALPGQRVVVDKNLNEELYGAPLSSNQMKKQKTILRDFLAECYTSKFAYNTCDENQENETQVSEKCNKIPRYVATVSGVPLVTSAGPCTVAALSGARIH